MILIVDASYYFYKAFYGSPADPLGGFAAMMQQALDYHEPNKLIFAIDAGRETFRTKLFPGYKVNRPAQPAPFHEAVALIKEAYRDSLIAAPGFEADDVIGSLCAKYCDDDRIIMAKDKDLMQLVTDGVSMWDNGAWVREAEVIAKFGVSPALVTDVLGLSGDSGDGIPGVPGIGAKTAALLVSRFGTLEEIYEKPFFVNRCLSMKLSMSLRQSKDLAFLSRELATIRTDIELET